MQIKSTYDPATGELLSDSFETQTVEKFDAQRSMHSGETRPDYLHSGDLWLKTKNGIAVGIYQWFESNGINDGTLIAMIPSTDSEYQAGVSTSTSVSPNQVKGDIEKLDLGKANVSLDNATPSQSFKNNTLLWAMPDYARSFYGINSYYTATADCWVMGFTYILQDNHTMAAALNSASGLIISEGSYNKTGYDSVGTLPMFFLQKGNSAHFVQINKATDEVLYRNTRYTVYPCIGAV